MGDPGIRSRPMPLKMDRVSPRDLDIIRRWIEAGAPK
jgi:hypothetical protein